MLLAATVLAAKKEADAAAAPSCSGSQFVSGGSAAKPDHVPTTPASASTARSLARPAKQKGSTRSALEIFHDILRRTATRQGACGCSARGCASCPTAASLPTFASRSTTRCPCNWLATPGARRADVHRAACVTAGVVGDAYLEKICEPGNSCDQALQSISTTGDFASFQYAQSLSAEDKEFVLWSMAPTARATRCRPARRARTTSTRAVAVTRVGAKRGGRASKSGSAAPAAARPRAPPTSTCTMRRRAPSTRPAGGPPPPTIRCRRPAPMR